MWLLYAAGSAICFGIRGILYQWTSRQPADRHVLLLGVYVSGALIAALLNLFVGQEWTRGALVGLLMGLFSFVSNASMHKGYSVGKASIIALLTSLPPLVVVLGSYLLWNEKLSPMQGLAFGLVVLGVLLIRFSPDLSLGRWHGAGWAVLALFGFAFTDMASKQATLSGGETLPSLIVMYATGSILFACMLGWQRLSARRRGRNRRLEPGAAEYAADTSVGGAAQPVVSASLEDEAERTVAASVASGEHHAVAAGSGMKAIQGAREQTSTRTVTVLEEREQVLTCKESDLAEPESALARHGTGLQEQAGIQEVPGSTAPKSKPKWSTSKTFITGLAVGISNISGMILIMPAMKLGVTGLVSAVVSLNMLLVMLYARVFLRESFTRLEVAGILLALCGVLTLRIGG